MDFRLPDDVEQLRLAIRSFVDDEVIAQEIDRDDQVPPAILRSAAALGLFGVTIPEEYGGIGLSSLGRAIVHQELARAGATHEVRAEHQPEDRQVPRPQHPPSLQALADRIID